MMRAQVARSFSSVTTSSARQRLKRLDETMRPAVRPSDGRFASDGVPCRQRLEDTVGLAARDRVRTGKCRRPARCTVEPEPCPVAKATSVALFFQRSALASAGARKRPKSGWTVKNFDVVVNSLRTSFLSEVAPLVKSPDLAADFSERAQSRPVRQHDAVTDCRPSVTCQRSGRADRLLIIQEMAAEPGVFVLVCLAL